MPILPRRERRARQAVARLTERTGIDDVRVADAAKRGDVRVPHQAGLMMLLQALEIVENLAGVGVDVLGEQVFVDRPSRGGVDEEQAVGLVADG